jgi:hypothetical protein
MSSSYILRRVALVRTDVSMERIASIIGVTRIGELETLALISTLLRVPVTANVVRSSPIFCHLDGGVSSEVQNGFLYRRRHSS